MQCLPYVIPCAECHSLTDSSVMLMDVVLSSMTNYYVEQDHLSQDKLFTNGRACQLNELLNENVV